MSRSYIMLNLGSQEINKLTSVALKADVGMFPENKQKNRYVNIQACKLWQKTAVFSDIVLSPRYMYINGNV